MIVPRQSFEQPIPSTKKSSQTSMPITYPSPQIGSHVSFEVRDPPEQVNLGSFDEQSLKQPRSVPASQFSGAILLPSPHIGLHGWPSKGHSQY